MNKTNIKVLAVLFFVAGIFFHQVIIGDDLFLSSDALSAKTISYGIELAQDKYDEYPLWMPWIFSGVPSTHSMQNISSYYFPHHIISIIKDIGLPWFWNFFLHFIFCGFGMYLFLKRLKLSHEISLFGAISFMLIPYMVVMIVHGHGSQVMTAAYIPWIMWAMLNLKNSLTLKNIGILSLLIGLQLQRAHIQIAYYTWMLMIAYLIFVFISYHQHRYNIKFYCSWLLSSFIGFGVASWIYIPLINYVGLSNRSISDGGASLEYATSWSLHPIETLTMLLPFSFGFGDATYFGYMPFTNFPNYASIVLVLLSICAFYNNSNNRLIFFFLFIFVFSLFISFGKYTPLYHFLYDWLPYFNKFRVPSMILIISQFCICVLASIGLQNLLSKAKDRDISLFNILGLSSLVIAMLGVLRYFFHDFSSHRIQHQIINSERISMLWNDSLMIFFILFLCFTIFYLLLNKKISSTQFVFLAIAILLIDIGRVDKRIINPPNDIANTVLKNKKYLNAQFNEDEIIKFLKEDKTKFRVLPLGSFADNRLVAFNIETVTGYHPAKLALYEKLMSEVGMNENILKLLNVKYLLSPRELSDEQESNLSLVRVKSGKYYNNFEYKDAYVYEYMHSEPRIQFVHNLSFINSDIEGYNLLLNQDFSISNDSFLSKNDMDKINLEDISYNTNSSLEIIEWTPNKIIIASNVDGDKNHFAVLSESYFPYGWEVEGALGSHIFKVDNFIRGFMVSPGKSQITLSFKPKDISYGSLLTYFFLILILILIFSAKIRPLNERI